MAEQSSATPNSATESGTPGKLPATKDKQCPYCGQPFTSSSLGRHLDLYIKEKNPKPPDGIHNIDEIRKSRGGITRRQARNSSVGTKRENSMTPAAATSTSRAHSIDEQRSPSIGRPSVEHKVRTRFNEANWQATGVINHIPPAQRDNGRDPPPRFEGRRESNRRWQAKSGWEQKQKMGEERDEARAAELALREVLGSIKAASARTPLRSTPFDFNPYEMSFPALCLHCLPAPTTIFGIMPFGTSESYSPDPPGPTQFSALQANIRDRFVQWRRFDRDIPEDKKDNNGYSDGWQRNANDEDGHLIGAGADEEEEKVIQHVIQAFNHWTFAPDKQKSENWRLEVVRAYARSEEKRKTIESDLQKAQQEINHLKAQVDTLSRCQQPREFFLHPPITIPLLKDTAKQLDHEFGKDMAGWDYDGLMQKWRAVIKDNRKTSLIGMAAQKPLDAPTPHQQGNNHSTPNSASGILNGSGSSYPGMTQSSRPDMDEDDDEELDDIDNGDQQQQQHQQQQLDHGGGGRHRAPQALMDRGVLDPSLDGSGGVGVGMDGIEGQHGDVNAEGFMGGRMLMGLSTDFGSLNGAGDGAGPGMNG
ncbi:MAG: hypothetical protein M1827_007762 [Pycnora praestabilis]|nr:MAG: hypothetical protein M1827_007762 [Pycnora praestabilis]